MKRVKQECGICLDDNDNRKFTEDVCTSDNCRKSMHKFCLNSWLVKTPTCPFCRAVRKPQRILNVTVNGKNHDSFNPKEIILEYSPKPVYHDVEKEITALSYNKDGTYIAVGYINGDISIYRNEELMYHVNSFTAHGEKVTSIAWHTEKNWFLSSGEVSIKYWNMNTIEDGNARFFNINDDDELENHGNLEQAKFDFEIWYYYNIKQVVWNPTGKQFASIDDSNNITVFNFNDEDINKQGSLIISDGAKEIKIIGAVWQSEKLIVVTGSGHLLGITVNDDIKVTESYELSDYVFSFDLYNHQIIIGSDTYVSIENGLTGLVTTIAEVDEVDVDPDGNLVHGFESVAFSKDGTSFAYARARKLTINNIKINTSVNRETDKLCATHIMFNPLNKNEIIFALHDQLGIFTMDAEITYTLNGVERRKTITGDFTALGAELEDGDHINI
jgi:WD40 repeat protein